MLSTLAACILSAAAFNQEPPRLLVSLLAVEGGWVGARIGDGDGSADLGLGQVNTFWIKEVARSAQRTADDAERLLQWDPCFNVRVAAAIWRYETVRAGGDLWQGVGHYHSPDPAEAAKYRAKVEAMGKRLYGDGLMTMQLRGTTAKSVAAKR